MAGAAVLASAPGASADGLTFTWSGNENGTSYGRGGNWEVAPVLDAEGNVVETTAVVPSEGDWAIVTAGTPTMTSNGGWSTFGLDLSGGQFTVRSSQMAAANFTVDTLLLGGSGLLSIGSEEKYGQSWFAASDAVITGGAASGFGILNASNSISQSGGDVSQLTINTPSYTHSGGTLGAIVTTDTYELTSAAASSTGATIVAAGAFHLRPDSGTAIVDARLSGTGDLVKSGAGAVVLTNDNDFTGAVVIEAGLLELRNGNGLPDDSAVHIADVAGATLLLTDSETIGSLSGGGAAGGSVLIAEGMTLTVGDETDTTFLGTIGGETASLVKQGIGTLTLGGEIMLGGLSVTGGTLQIGTGKSTATASFESATIDSGATLYVAEGATLTIRVPSNIVNNGHLINFGTVHDDLENAAAFDNYATYNADVAGNTSDINNHSGGVWKGKVLTNEGHINNLDGARWVGNVVNNAGEINNEAGATWIGDITSSGGVSNKGNWTGDLTNRGSVFNSGTWTGDVLASYGQISNEDGAHWVGNIVGNSNAIFNKSGGTWSGHVLANRRGVAPGQILNFGTWINGTVEGNTGMILNLNGSWTGDILGNSDFISNNTNESNLNPDGVNAAHWTGDVRGNGRTGTITNDLGGTWNGRVNGNQGTINNHGTWLGGTISGNNGGIFTTATGTWTGDVAGNSGWISNAGGTWNGNILGNSGDVSNDNAPDEVGIGYWNGDVVANNATVFNGGGGIWTGSVLGNGASGYIKNDALGEWVGAVRGNAGRIENRGTWSGALAGNAGIIYNSGLWDGAVLAANTDDAHTGNTGTIFNSATGTWSGDVLGNAGTISTSGVWDGDFTSAGIVNARQQINGAFTNTGLLHLTGSLTGITTLTNGGILDMRGASAGQTLTAETASFGPGASYNISVDSAGHADRLIATTAVLDGTVRVTASPTGGNYNYMTPYTILSADSISGTFSGVATDLAFLDPQLDYLTAGSVTLNLARNNVGFAQVGVTGTQKAAAAGAQSLGAGSPIYDAILWLNADQAEHAFDALAGAALTSTESAAMQGANLIARVATSRIDQAFDAVGGNGGDSVSNYAQGPTLTATPSLTNGVWGQLYGARDSMAATGTLAGVETMTGGIVAGIDGLLDDWRLGVMVQAGTTGTAVAGLNSFSTGIDYGIGVYGGRQWGNTRLALGATFTRHDISASREVAFPGFSDELTARYSAGTAQAFTRLSHEFELGAVSLTPYAGLSHVSHATDGLTETGGPAALTSAASLIDATFATLGLGIERKVVVADDMLLTVGGGIGWQHAFADTPSALHSLAGGTGFAVPGAPIVADMLLLSAGFNLDVSATTTLNFTYDGQIGGGAQTHALKASWNNTF